MVQQLFHRHISGNFRAGKVDHLRNSVIKAQLSLFHQLQQATAVKSFVMEAVSNLVSVLLGMWKARFA